MPTAAGGGRGARVNRGREESNDRMGSRANTRAKKRKQQANERATTTQRLHDDGHHWEVVSRWVEKESWARGERYLGTNS